MWKSKFDGTEIVGILKNAESGVPVAVWRKPSSLREAIVDPRRLLRRPPT
jgi:hypothetical protein